MKESAWDVTTDIVSTLYLWSLPCSEMVDESRGCDEDTMEDLRIGDIFFMDRMALLGEFLTAVYSCCTMRLTRGDMLGSF